MTKSLAPNPMPAAFTFLDDEEREIYEAIENADHTPVNLLTREKKLEIEARAAIVQVKPLQLVLLCSDSVTKI